MRSSLVRELLKLTTEHDLISFAGGLPGADLFPIAEFHAASTRVRMSTAPRRFCTAPLKARSARDEISAPHGALRYLGQTRQR